MLKRILLGALFVLMAGVVTAQDTVPAGEKLLVWAGPGVSASVREGNDEGDLMFMNGDGSTELVLEIPNNTEHVIPCGDQATSPDGRQFVFYVGRERGTLYLMTDANPQLQTLANNVNLMTCVGDGTFMFSPDGLRYAYFDYQDGFNTEVSFRSNLVIGDSQTYAQIASFQDVAAFTFTPTGAAFIGFFLNDKDEAIEATVNVWDGSSEREITFTEAGENCYFTSASLSPLADGRLSSVMSYLCKQAGTGTSWQFYTVDPANRSMTQLLNAESKGAYFAFSRTNTLYVSPNGTHVFFTTPDGFTNFTVGLNVVNLAQTGVTPVIAQHGIMPRNLTLPYAYENHSATLSPDRRLLAMVTNDPSNQATLSLIDLSAPDLPPVNISAGEKGNKVLELLFTPDSSKLIFVAGGENNILYMLDAATGTETRVARGRFGQGVLSPDGTRIAIINRGFVAERQPLYDTLVVIDFLTGAETKLWQGSEIVDSTRVTNNQFIYPLAWRKVQ